MFRLRMKIKRWIYKRRIQNTIHVLSLIDEALKYKGIDRRERKSLKIIKRELQNNKHDLINLLTEVASNIMGPSDGGRPSRVGRSAVGL